MFGKKKCCSRQEKEASLEVIKLKDEEIRKWIRYNIEILRGDYRGAYISGKDIEALRKGHTVPVVVFRDDLNISDVEILKIKEAE